MHRLATVIPGAIFATIVVGLGFSLTKEPHRAPVLLVDKPMPAFALPPPGGDVLGLTSENLIGQVSLLNVFASWCPSCRLEHPTLLELARSASIPIFGINWKDNASNVGRWLADGKNPYRRVGFDGSGSVGRQLGITGVPETYVIDRTGRIRYRHPGPLDREVWRAVFAPLLAELQVRQ